MSTVAPAASPNKTTSASSLPPLAPPLATPVSKPPVDTVAPGPSAPNDRSAATTLDNATPAPAPAPAARRSQSAHTRFRAWAFDVWVALCTKLFGRR